MLNVKSLFCFEVLCVLSSFSIISLGKRELVAFLLLCSVCHVASIVLWPFLVVSWIRLWYLIVAFSGQPNLPFLYLK